MFAPVRSICDVRPGKLAALASLAEGDSVWRGASNGVFSVKSNRRAEPVETGLHAHNWIKNFIRTLLVDPEGPSGSAPGGGSLFRRTRGGRIDHFDRQSHTEVL
jgi:hypothetical protein